MSTASGTALVTVTVDDRVLDAFFPAPALGDDAPEPDGLDAAAGHDERRGVRTEVRRVAIDLDRPPCPLCACASAPRASRWRSTAWTSSRA